MSCLVYPGPSCITITITDIKNPKPEKRPENCSSARFFLSPRVWKVGVNWRTSPARVHFHNRRYQWFHPTKYLNHRGTWLGIHHTVVSGRLVFDFQWGLNWFPPAIPFHSSPSNIAGKRAWNCGFVPAGSSNQPRSRFKLFVLCPSFTCQQPSSSLFWISINAIQYRYMPQHSTSLPCRLWFDVR